MNGAARVWLLFASVVLAGFFLLAYGMASFLDRTTPNIAGLLVMLGAVGCASIWLLVRASRYDNE